MRAFFIIRIHGEGAVLVTRVEEDDQQSGAERRDAAAQPRWRAPLLLDRIVLRLPLPALSYSKAEACGGYGHGYECHVPGTGVVAPHGCSQRCFWPVVQSISVQAVFEHHQNRFDLQVGLAACKTLARQVPPIRRTRCEGARPRGDA